jgi:hypothetical protein
VERIGGRWVRFAKLNGHGWRRLPRLEFVLRRRAKCGILLGELGDVKVACCLTVGCRMHDVLPYPGRVAGLRRAWRLVGGECGDWGLKSRVGKLFWGEKGVRGR